MVGWGDTGWGLTPWSYGGKGRIADWKAGFAEGGKKCDMNACGGHMVANHFCSLAQGKQAFWQQQERDLQWPRPVQAHFLHPKPTQVPFLPQTNLHPKPTQVPFLPQTDLHPKPTQVPFLPQTNLHPKPTQVPFLPQTSLHPKPTQAPRIDISKHDLKRRIRPSLTSYPFDFTCLSCALMYSAGLWGH